MQKQQIMITHPPQSQSISSDWIFRQIPLNSTESNTNQWYPAEIPGYVHLDLMRNKLIPDPNYRDNEAKVQWVEQYDWEYQTNFNVSKDILLSNVIELRFEGLDTHATVYLNDKLILKANNFFRSWIVNVKDLIKAINNSIRVVFEAAIRFDNVTKESFQPIQIPADNPNRTPFSRKPRYHYGSDWGPRLVTCGINKEIKLVGYDKGKINNFNLETLEIIKTTGNDNTIKNSARISAEAFIEKVDNGSLNYKLVWWETPNKQILIDSGPLTLQDKGHVLHYRNSFNLDNIELWWSKDIGSQKLYSFSFQLYNNENKLIDEAKRRMGIRTVKLIQLDDNDKNGSSFNIRLNNKDIFIKGANYIPPDSFSTRVTQEKYNELIYDIIGANYNGIRIWGGGYFESEYFYDKCDENGILILQDFMFACEMYPGSPDYMSNYEAEFIENVLNLKSHPSIVLWIGNNEVNEAWHNWGLTYNLTQDNIDIVWNWYLSIFEQLIPKVIAEYDSQRPYWPSSPLYGYGHPESLRYGDSHYWSVWAAGQPIENYRNNVGRFMTEYGMQGILDINSISKFTLPEDRNLNSPSIKMHEKHLKGFPNLNQYINETYGILPKDFDDYVYVSQIMQAYAIELAVSSHRNHKPYCMGTLYWQLNDAWPSISWASVDYYGHWKALHYSAKRFNQDLILMGRENNESGLIEIRILSEFLDEKVVNLEIYQYNFDGDLLDLLKFNDYNVQGLSNDIVQTFEMNDESKKTMFYYLRVLEQNGKIWENYYFMIEPKKLSFVTDGKIELVYKKEERSFVITSDYFVKNLYIYCNDKYLKLSDNYFDLLPKKQKVVKILNFNQIGEVKEEEIKIKTYNDIIKKYR